MKNLFTPHPPSKKYQVWTDGSYEKGLAGYGYIVLENNEPISYGYGPVKGKQTNQRAELSGIYFGLQKAVQENLTDIELISDSNYCIQSLTVWYKNWQKNNWKTANGYSVENQDLIKPILDLLSSNIKVSFIHVYSHQGVYWNEEVDKMAYNGRLLKKSA